MSKLTTAQRRVLASDRICWSKSTGRTWAYDADGESFDVAPQTAGVLAGAGWLVYTGLIDGVHQYRPRTPAEREDEMARRRAEIEGTNPEREREMRELAERCLSHMGMQDFQIVLNDCHAAARAILELLR